MHGGPGVWVGGQHVQQAATGLLVDMPEGRSIDVQLSLGICMHFWLTLQWDSVYLRGKGWAANIMFSKTDQQECFAQVEP